MTFPINWFWTVAGDTSRAWSSALGAYVDKWDDKLCTPIESEHDLSDVLANYSLVGPVPTAKTVANELLKRQCHILNINPPNASEFQRLTLAGTREATALQNIKLKHLQNPSEPDWSTEQEMWAVYLEVLENRLSALEEAADMILADTTQNVKTSKLWPE